MFACYCVNDVLCSVLNVIRSMGCMGWLCVLTCWCVCRFTARHNQPATVLRWIPKSLDPSGRTVVVGFADGVARVLLRAKAEWKRCVDNLEVDGFDEKTCVHT